MTEDRGQMSGFRFQVSGVSGEKKVVGGQVSEESCGRLSNKLKHYWNFLQLTEKKPHVARGRADT